MLMKNLGLEEHASCTVDQAGALHCILLPLPKPLEEG